MNIGELNEWLENAHTLLNERQTIIGSEIIKEILARVSFLLGVGLDYLSIDNPARTLSGGEAQRIRLATQIGSKLEEVLYILDEPSIGLHPRDNEKLIDQDSSYFTVSQNNNEDSELEEEIFVQSLPYTKVLSELDLYPFLIDFLKIEYKLYCQRIDDKRSKNQRGAGGNQWLHPDIVAMQAIDKEWHELVRTCVQEGEGRRVRLWSFEVKKELNSSNIRSSFFQAVSNSSWANEGYLVTTSITDNIEQELRMLSALHGIGVIILDTENPSESEIFLPAKSRAEIDWQSVNRIVVENDDFKDYIELVSTYYQTGRIRSRDWNKI
jgi:hypothetical protein